MSRITKFQRFIDEPMFEKTIMDVPGIDRATAKEFDKVEITKAIQIYILFKMIKMDEAKFKEFLRNCVGMSSRNVDECIDSLIQYNEKHEDNEEFNCQYDEFKLKLQELLGKMVFYCNFLNIFLH
uniref:CDC37_C domain-containing protein n=1 Tax=Strongyloides venezuelensis TaxID=75913 RepID=A0A0K0FWY7_STRVS